MGNMELPPSQRRQQIHLCLTNQIIPIPLEPRMLLLLHHENHIPRLDTRGLIRLPSEPHLMPRLHPLVDMHFEDFTFLRSLLSITGLALVLGVDHLPRSITLPTRLLNLLDHRTELPERDAHTLSSTGGTFLDGAGFAAETFAGLAEDGFGEGEFLDLAFVEVFEGDGDAVDEVLAATGALRT